MLGVRSIRALGSLATDLDSSTAGRLDYRATDVTEFDTACTVVPMIDLKLFLMDSSTGLMLLRKLLACSDDFAD